MDDEKVVLHLSKREAWMLSQILENCMTYNSMRNNEDDIASVYHMSRLIAWSDTIYGKLVKLLF